MIESPCTRCHGEGRVRAQREVSVEVPPGVTSENYITLRGEGSIGPRGGPRGDIIVLLNVEDDPRFSRDGAHLITERPVTFTQAALGADVKVTSLEGKLKMSVPPGTQSDTILRLRGQGLPELQGSGRGDLLVRVVVFTPRTLTDVQRELLEELREIEDAAPDRIESDQGRGFWSRVREAFSGR